MVPDSKVTLFHVANDASGKDFKPVVNEMEFKSFRDVYVCNGIVRYTLVGEILESYHTGMSIEGPDHPLDVFKDGEFWTRDRKLAELVVSVWKHGSKLGQRAAKVLLAQRLGLSVDEG
ncbi:hypothetical protein M0Q28_00790 [Patescibacteria group bacterium]|jgi:hypothetical protein|nr:hypothetical protein [Patescibacteria group bacterium]